MRISRRDEVVSLIYDAAVDGSRWNDAVIAMSGALNCHQGTLEIHDPYAGFSTRLTPLCDPDYQRSHVEYYGKLFSLSGRTASFPVGRLFGSEELGLTSDAFRSSVFYNEWWRPQGAAGGALMANVARDGRAAAVVTMFKPVREGGFAEREKEDFSCFVGHLIRAVAIQRRLRLAESVSALAAARAPEGFVLVDQGLRVLLGDDGARSRLRAAGLLAGDGMVDRVSSGSGRLEHLVAGAIAGTVGVSAGDYDHRAPDGSLLRVSVLPCAARDGPGGLAIDRPAALLCLSDPAAHGRAQVERLVRAYGLTPAEAAVAVEIVRGDGRAAAARRLGIQPTTVRSHLSAIFDKLDIHRQAELVRLVGSV